MQHETIEATSAVKVGAKKLLLAALFASLTGIGAFIRIPISPVPVTLQVFFVLLSGLVLGPVWGPASQLMYLSMGLFGMPIFAAPPYSGPLVLIGPTGGYLWGFVIASGATGFVSNALGRRIKSRLIGALCACLAGIAAIYTFGTCWLATWLNLHGKSALLAYDLGVRPFIIVDLLKAAAAALVGGSVSARRFARANHERY